MTADRTGLGADSGRAAVTSYGDAFGAVDRTLFHHSIPHTSESLVALLQSRSYYLAATAQRQAELEREVLNLTRTHPDLAARTEFELPYVTVVFRAVRV